MANLCKESVYRPYASNGRCSHPAKPGKDYCGVHSPEAEARRRAKSEAKYEALQNQHRARQDVVNAEQRVVREALAYEERVRDVIRNRNGTSDCAKLLTACTMLREAREARDQLKEIT